MWPFIRGADAVSLRRNDDLMFTVQAQMGLALVLLMFLTILTVLSGILLKVWQAAQVLLAVELLAGAWFGLAYSQVSRWRATWAKEHVGEERQDDYALNITLPSFGGWKRQAAKADVKPKAEIKPEAKAQSNRLAGVAAPSAA